MDTTPRRPLAGPLRSLLAALLLLPACAAASGGADASARPPGDAAPLARDVAWLADPGREGRAPGSDGLAEAARWLAGRFAALGLAPAGANGSYLQPFRAPEPAGEAAPGGEARAHEVEVANVVGLLPGRDPALRDEFVVVGAHYDHVGRGAFASMAPERRGEIHPGADDNASGTAGLLSLARRLVAEPPRRSVVFVAFSAEEAGLFGSSHYASRPPAPLARTAAMLNLDMIGRLGDAPVRVFGADTAEALEPLVRAAARAADVPVRLEEEEMAPSDHWTFIEAGVPSLLLSSGLHADYHTPGDVPARLDLGGMRVLLDLAEHVVRTLADRDEAPRFAEDASPRRLERYTGMQGAAWLGSVPAFGADAAGAEGVRLADVRPESPAERAGLRPGDVLVRFGGAPVRSLAELAALLRAARPGDEVDIELRRGGEVVHTRARLEARP